jgi:HEAT repeat protein
MPDGCAMGIAVMIYIELIGIIVFVVWILASSVLEEVVLALRGKRQPLAPLVTRGQKPAIRSSVARLTSPRRYVRVEGLELLAQFNDPSCVPALIRVVDLYLEDVPFLIQTVQLIAQLGDERALPVLRRLSVNRHPALMQAAQAAIDAIEPRSVLLRAGNAPANAPDTLLRAAMPAVSHADPDVLLRPDKQSRP